MNVRAGVFSVGRGVVLAGWMVVAAGCGDTSPVGVELRVDGLRVGEVARAVRVGVPYGAGVYQAVIGPDGGVLSFGVGTLTFPAGALERPTMITARVDGYSIAADFGPSGLSFPAHSQPTLSFSLPSTNEVVTIAYVDDDLRIRSLLETSIENRSMRARARLRHFSPYILAQN